MRWLLCLLVFAGCTPQPQNLQPLVAVAGAYTMMQQPDSPDGPVDGRCDNCGGTGKLGDGRVAVDCPVCGGDGVIGNEVQHDPVTVGLDDLPEPVSSAGVRSVLRCESGKCSTRR